MLTSGPSSTPSTGPCRAVRPAPLKDRFVVAFEGVDSIEGAESLRGTVLRSAPLDEEGALWVDELIGASVLAPDGTALGVVAAVERNPASDLLVLASGALIPTHFVVGTVVDGSVTVEVPEGLLVPVRIDVYTLFPELVDGYAAGSILGRARSTGRSTCASATFARTASTRGAPSTTPRSGAARAWCSRPARSSTPSRRPRRPTGRAGRSSP